MWLECAFRKKTAWADSSSPFFLLDRLCSCVLKGRWARSDFLGAMNWQTVVENTVTGLGYDLVDCERSAKGLLRVYIDRLADDPAGEYIVVEDCEKVTRQLQHVLEVEGCAYERLEVSSPGLDRPLNKPADYARFVGAEVAITLKQAFQGRKNYSGVLQAEGEGWRLVMQQGKVEQALDFSLDEVKEARLVPVLDFKGRRFLPQAQEAQTTQEGSGETDGDRKQ
jgi:ribosome maturation factor RimP